MVRVSHIRCHSKYGSLADMHVCCAVPAAKGAEYFHPIRREMTNNVGRQHETWAGGAEWE